MVAVSLPNSNAIWPQFRSPLEWDVFAVSTYATVSIFFWYMGMIPDLAVIRDRAKQTWRKYFYGILAMGWRNANNHWRNFEMAYLLLAGLSTPLVLSVHTIVSFDFAVANLHSWHTPYSPLFCSRSHFFRVRDGTYASPSAPGGIPIARFDHAKAHRQYVQDHLGDRQFGRLRLLNGIFHCLVRSQL